MALLTHRGGHGRPVVLVHGLMGRGSTWSRQLPWLRALGTVYTYDAPGHRGYDPAGFDPAGGAGAGTTGGDGARPVDTERYVADLGDALAELDGPAVLVGHSMGALHAWCLAARRPERVSGVVVEDMAPDFRGRTTGAWEPWLTALPVEFDSAETVFDTFGKLAGRYFLESFDRTATGWRLHGRPADWIEIAGQWGRRDYWEQWRAVRAPCLLIEAGDSVTPPGQMLRMHETGWRTRHLLVAGVGHLVHDAAPAQYRRGVERFLATLPGDS